MKLSSEAVLKRRNGVKGGLQRRALRGGARAVGEDFLGLILLFQFFSATSCDGNAFRLKMCPLPDMEGRM